MSRFWNGGQGGCMATTTTDRRAARRPSASPRRVNSRNKTLKSAKIVFNKNQSVIDCFVRDLSPTGARLKLGDVAAVPRNFILELNDGTRHDCERVRAMGLEIGVRFLN
jgi:hypothetical protein